MPHFLIQKHKAVSPGDAEKLTSPLITPPNLQSLSSFSELMTSKMLLTSKALAGDAEGYQGFIFFHLIKLRF